MRLWPYQMIPVLPTQYLLSQWRECLAIAGMVYGDGTNPSLENINHATINRLKEYPMEHFVAYCDLVRDEFMHREFTIGTNAMEKLECNIDFTNVRSKIKISPDRNFKTNGKFEFLKVIFGNGDEYECTLLADFHSLRYIKQCLYMFQEKYDCNMLTGKEWNSMQSYFDGIF